MLMYYNYIVAGGCRLLVSVVIIISMRHRPF